MSRLDIKNRGMVFLFHYLRNIWNCWTGYTI
jgi:hypothetical protein